MIFFTFLSKRPISLGAVLLILGVTFYHGRVEAQDSCPPPTPSSGTPPPDSGTPTVPPLLICEINPRIQYQVLTKMVPQGTLLATDTKTLNLPADATDIKISLRGYSVDDHSINLSVNSASVISMSESSDTRSYNRILATPIAIPSLKAGANTFTASAGENPKYNTNGGHIGAGFCFQGTYRASKCDSPIGVEQPDPATGGCGQS